MNIREQLEAVGLNKNNCIVIGSGILNALGIRESHDIDVVVEPDTYIRFKQDGKYKVGDNHGREVLENGTLELGTSWEVLGKVWHLSDFNDTVVIDEVRYVPLKFILEVKKSWASENNPRQKDLEDIKSIEQYLSKTSTQS